MVTDIGSELRRTGMDAAIKNSIAASAGYFRNRRLPFNVKTFTFATVAQQAYYASADSTNIPLIAKFDAVTYVDGQLEFDLTKVDPEWMDINSLGAAYYATPEKYAYVDGHTNGRMRLFPTPSIARTIRVDAILEVIDAGQAVGLQRLLRTNIQSIPNGYASEWFTNSVAYEAMKYWAKGHLYINTLRNTPAGSEMFALADAMVAEIKSQAQSSDAAEDYVECEQF